MNKDLLGSLKKLLEPLRTRIMLMISRGFVTLVDDSTKMQTIQAGVLAEEIQSGLERFQQFGFTGCPMPGAECVIVYPGGNRDHGIIVALDDRNFRKKDLTQGQTAMYDAVASFFLLSADGKALLDAAIETHIKSATVKLGAGSAQEKILNGETFQNKYNQHTHLAFGVPTTVPVVPSDLLDLSLAVTAAKLQS